MKTGCSQVNIPEVDNSSPCTDFIYSECVTVNRRSPVLKNPKNSDLNTYFDLLDKKLMQLNSMIIQIKNQQQILIDLINETNTGAESLNIGTWAPGD